MAKLFVGGFSRSTNESELDELFSKFGQVCKVMIIRDFEGRTKSYGFVTFASELAVDKVMRTGQVLFRGRRLTVGRARTEQKVGVGDREELNKTSGVDSQAATKPYTYNYCSNSRVGQSGDLRFVNKSPQSRNVKTMPNSLIRSPNKQARISSQPIHARYFKTPPSRSQHRPSPVHMRSFSSPGSGYKFNYSCEDQTYQQASLPSSCSQSETELFNYSCSPYQPLPLVFPIYQLDTFYMSTVPLQPGYCIKPHPDTAQV